MRTGVAALIALMGLVPTVASAQDGLRTAALPERSLTTPPPRGGYYATPRTYRPDPRRRPRPPVFGYYGPQVLYPYDQPYVQPVIVVQVPAAQPARLEPPPPVAPPSPYVAGTPGRPKAFYVIPGCYAGDRQPDPESLAPGCSITRLRVIGPS